jgi:hypothetical protein
MMRNNTLPRRGQTISHARGSSRISFQSVNAAALARAEDVCRWLLPGGRRAGREYVVRSPKRADRNLGSMKISLATGKWADFATADHHGRDLVALAAWVFEVRQSEAAQRLAAFLHVTASARHD